MKYAVLDYDGFICKAFYAAVAREDMESAYSILDDLTDEAIDKACYFFGDHCKVIYAVSAHSWKKDIFPTYKAQRKKNEYLSVFRDNVITERKDCITRFDGLEADEIISILLSSLRLEDEVLVFSDDKDLQYLSSWYCKVNITEEPQPNLLGISEFFAQLLAGDKEDNITGIPGIGMVKAHKLLNDDYSFEKVIQVYKEQGIPKEECYKNLMLVTPLHYKYNNNYSIVSYASYLIRKDKPISNEYIQRMIDGQCSFISSKIDRIYKD